MDRPAKTERLRLRDRQAVAQRMRGVSRPGCLLQGGPLLLGRAEGHLHGPRAWILFGCPIAGPPSFLSLGASALVPFTSCLFFAKCLETLYFPLS